MAKQRRHLVRAFEILFLAVELHPFGIIYRLADLHTEQNVLAARIRVLDIVEIIGREQRHASGDRRDPGSAGPGGYPRHDVPGSPKRIDQGRPPGTN
jgi:hypothetical protein